MKISSRVAYKRSSWSQARRTDTFLVGNGFIHDYLGLSPRRKPPATRCELLRPLTHTYLPETESCSASPIWMLARDNRAEAFLFPIYEDDSATPKINRVLLLELGD